MSGLTSFFPDLQTFGIGLKRYEDRGLNTEMSLCETKQGEGDQAAFWISVVTPDGMANITARFQFLVGCTVSHSICLLLCCKGEQANWPLVAWSVSDLEVGSCTADNKCIFDFVF